MELVPQLVVSGIAAGALYALVAIGLVLIYKATDIVNFAQGESVTVGAYMGWLLATQLGLPYLLVIVLVMAGSALVGVVVDVALGLMATPDDLVWRAVLLAAAFPVLAIGIALYLGSHTGAGPAEILSIFSKEGKRIHLRARPQGE